MSTASTTAGQRAWLAALAAILMITGVAACSTPEGEGATSADGIEIVDAWMRPGGAGANTAAYMVIRSSADGDDRLVAAGTDIAEMVQIHQTVWDGEVASMQHLPDGLAIPSGGEVALEPGGYHVMIMGLSADLAEGDVVPLTLTFEGAGDIVIDVPVKTAEMGSGMNEEGDG